jgi:hypothetical protein
MGLWQISIDESSAEVDIVPCRAASYSLNALSILQNNPLGLEINPGAIIVDPVEHRVTLEARLWHPLQPVAGMFTAFDVRGIVFGPEVVNADGWTASLNPHDFASVPFGYIDGKLGTPQYIGNFTGHRFGYKYFCNGLGPDDDLVAYFRTTNGILNRGHFNEGSSARRRYILDWDGSNQGFLVFNYAVLASYSLPQPGSAAPWGLDDFDRNNANCAEAFCLTALASDNTAYFWSCTGGGYFDLDVEVWDWQGLDSTQVTLEAFDGSIDKQATSNYIPGSTAYSGIFKFNNVPVTPYGPGEIPMLVTVTDYSRTFGDSWYGHLLPQTNWRYDDYVYTMLKINLPVNTEPPCIPEIMNETFDGPDAWDHGPGEFWTVNWVTAGAADNRHGGLCYGNMSGITLTWCKSPPLIIKPGCYNLPLIMRMRHQIDMEEYYDRCWVEIKVGCADWKKIYPFCGLKYNSSGWWDGYHKEDWSRFMLPDLVDGDIFWIRFITHTLDGNNNCEINGFKGWQIFDIVIDDN